MKNHTLKAIAAFLALNILFTTGVAAANGIENSFESYENVFDLEEDFYSDFAELDQLEQQIKENGLLDYDALIKSNPELLSDLNLTNLRTINSVEATEGFSFDDMDWGSFAWGLLCCPVGFFVVAINGNKTSEQKASFWIGWGVGAVLNILYYAVAGNPYDNF